MTSQVALQVKAQPAMSSVENESDVDYSETEECGYDDYYNLCDDADNELVNQKKCDPEHFDFDCLTVDQVHSLNFPALCYYFYPCQLLSWLFLFFSFSPNGAGGKVAERAS